MPLPLIKRTNYSFLDYHKFGGYNTNDLDTNVDDQELTGGQNADVTIEKSLSKRKGHSLHGNYIGNTTQILDLISHEPMGGTLEQLTVYDTSILRNVAGTWTALTGVTMTTNKKTDHAYFPKTNKTYITNGTDYVVKYASGAAGDQTDTAFKKGTTIEHYKNRLLVGVGNVLWYTDLGVDTFSAGNYLLAPSDITGILTYYEKVLVFTKRKVYAISNFTFNGVISGPESFLPLRTDFGAIADRTVVKIDNRVYFLGQTSDNVAGIYVSDGLDTVLVSNDINPDMQDLAPASLVNACATAWGRYYRLAVTPSGQTVNTKEYIFDTHEKLFFPPYTNGQGGISCYAQFETSGQYDIYAGSQTIGEVFKLNQVNYDEIANQTYLTLGAVDTAIDANPGKRGAQSFKLSGYTTRDSVPINSVLLLLKKNIGTTTGLTVRIETDNNGVPSGSLADPQATTTITAFTSTSYLWYKASFTSVSLLGNTTYWIVLQHTTEGAGTSQYYWAGDGTSPTYANGNISTYLASAGGTNTYNPDASPETTSVDGDAWIQEANDTWTNLVNNTSNGNQDRSDNSNEFSVGYSNLLTNKNKWEQLRRGFLLFDTSSLPDDAVITSAKISLYCTYKTIPATYLQAFFNVTASNPTSNTAIVYGDYPNVSNTDFVNTSVELANLTTNAYNDFVLNATGISAISLTGISKFAIRTDNDIDNLAPVWAFRNSSTLANFSSAEGTNKPRLVITYTTGLGTDTWTSDATKDQNFRLYEQASFDSFADTKAFHLAPEGQKYKIKDAYVTADASGDYNLQCGLNNGQYASFEYQDLNLSGGSSVFGSTLVIGQSVLGEVSRGEGKIKWSGSRGRIAKFRFRNAVANQPYTVHQFRVRYQIKDKFG